MSTINSTAFELTSTRLEDVQVMSPSFESIRDVLPLISAAAHSASATIRTMPQYLTWSTSINVVLIFLILANFKCLPFVYHLRILNGIRHMLKSQRSLKPLTPENLFQPLITSSSSPLMEVDVYGHKNNNTYFTDHDIARTHLLTTLFARGIEKLRGSVTMNGLSGKKRSAFTIPLGAVTCSFRKELKPYESYDMWTRILSWDEKWFYVVTHFVKKGAKIEPEEFTLYPQQNSTVNSRKSSRQESVGSISTRRSSADASDPKPRNSNICASAMSKVVFKDGRITISPQVMLENSGLLPVKNTDRHQEGLATAQVEANVGDGVGPLQAIDELKKLDELDHATDSGYESSRRSSMESTDRVLTAEEIEAERVRGLRLAKMLSGMTELENEFDSEFALGRHYDGYGIEGVVATLMQLGKLSNYQLL